MAGRKLSAKEELFCVKYVELGDAGRAYKEDHPRGNLKTCQEQASRWLAKPEIQARVAELRAVAVEKLAITVDDIAAQLDADRQFARENGQPAAAVSATVAKGKLLGFFVEKRDVTIGMRPDEARQVIAALAGKFGGKAS